MFPDDPELKPVPAAAAHLAAQAATPAGPVQRPQPMIAPLDAAAWADNYTLAYPLLVDGVPLTVIALRRITAGDVASLVMDDDRATSLNLRARALACGLHPAVFAALSGEDGVRLAEAVRPFLPTDLVSAEDMATEMLTGDIAG